VGNLGSEKRTKYGAVGAAVNLATRIESYTLGGEVLVDDTTRDAIGETLSIRDTLEVQPKGLSDSIRIHHVAGLGGVELHGTRDSLIELGAPIAIRFAFVTGKDVGTRTLDGEFRAISAVGARLETDEKLPERSDLRIELLDDRSESLPGSFYAKVTASEAGLLHFTTRSAALQQAIQAAIGSSHSTD